MPDLTGRAQRLMRHLLTSRPNKPNSEPDPGLPAALKGAAAIARVEAALGNDRRGSLAEATGLALAGLRATALASGPELAAAPDLLARAAG